MLKPISKPVRSLAIALLIIALLGLFIKDSSSVTSQVWVTNSMERIGLKDRPGDRSNLELYAARGEYESFQVVIKAFEDDFTITNVEVSDLTGRDDRIIPRSNITLYREHYVEIAQPSPTPKRTNVKPQGKGWYPDGLIPIINPQTKVDIVNAELAAIPFKLNKETNQPIWVDIFVPRDAEAGDYRGTYSVTSNLGTATGEITLTVWNFELPLKPSLKSAFLSWEQQDKNTIVELLKHKVMPVAKIDPEDERELIDRWGLSSIRLPFWSGANYKTCSMDPAPSTAEIRNAGLRHQLDLMLYVYPTDEIDNCQNLLRPFKEWARNIHQAGVKHLAVMSPVPELYDLVDIWVVNPSRYRDNRSEVIEVLRQGKEVWFYTFMVQGGNFPNWQIDFEPINFRIPHGFINQSLGLTGLLYWRVDLWTEDPWNDVDTAPNPDKSLHYPGEGMLIYPGEPVGIKGSVPSMRLKWIREGVEDYEYVEILKRWGQEDWAMETIREVAEDFDTWNHDPAMLRAARRKLGAKIHQLSL